MTIDNLTSTDVFVEKRILTKIIANNIKNNKGILEIDENGNELVTNVDSGDTPLYRLSKYNGEDSIMFYNPTTKNIQIANAGDFLNINIDFERGTKYYLGSKIIISTSREDNVFNIDLGEHIPLKVFLDGREVLSYSSNRNSITINGTDRMLIDVFSELVVYSYKSSSISDSTEFEIEYYQYENIWDKDLFLSYSYFDEALSIEEIKCFDSLSINQNTSKTMYRGGFRKSSDSRINYIDNTADFEIFDVDELTDMVQWVGNVEFRIILINYIFGRCILLNNCRINNGITLVFDKSRNTKKFTLSCGNYIDIKVELPSAYGKGKYGKGLYGSNTFIYNSHRVGE